MARSVSGVPRHRQGHPKIISNPLRRNDLRDPPLSVGASAPPPARDQGPDRSLPGPDAGHPCKVRGSVKKGKVAVPVACPIRQPTVGTGSHSRVPPYAR